MSVKRRKKLTVIVILLVLIEIFSVIFVWNITSDKETVLDNVKLRDNEKSLKGLAIMLETEHNSDDYEESNTSSWPTTGYKFNKEKSGCIDNSGSTIENSLSYDSTTNIVTVDTGVTTKCYIYFDKRYSLEELCTSGEDTLGECLTNNNSTIESLNDNVEGGLYRYQGTQELVDDNYICFGTTSKEECTSNTDAYMYRIIGIDENNQLKLIKKEALNETMQWWTDYTTDITWPNSLIYKNINGEKYLENSTYMPSGWSNKIVNYEWKYGRENDANRSAEEMYNIENNFNENINAKIGLIYIHDYYYSLKNTGSNCLENAECSNSWLHLKNNSSTDIEALTYELTMTTAKDDYNNYYIWRIGSAGEMYVTWISASLGIRPVFYLTTNETYASGNGTIDDPIMIGETKQLCATGDNLGDCLIENNSEIESLDNTAYSGMYRYTGTQELVDDNYICFGTTDKEECINNPDTYMYRIIGVTSAANSTLGLAANQVKVIKASSIGNYNWHGSNTSDTKWESSAMYTYLQGSSVLGSTSIIPSGWSDKISSIKWNIGDVNTYSGLTGSTVYGLEDNTQTSSTSKIGLMYLSDYFYAYTAGGGTDCYNNACTNWLTDTSNHTWTMTRYGLDGSRYSAWSVLTYGTGGYALTNEFAVRPVFYLNPDEVFVSGDGTTDNPIMLEKPKVKVGEFLIDNPTTGLNAITAYSGMYRYIGTEVNNYVRLSDGTNEVLYRIIGITSNENTKLELVANQIKVIKDAKIGNYSWHTSNSSAVKWESSSMYTYLQSSSVLDNASIIPNGWTDKISNVKWYYGDVQSYKNGSTIYGTEDNWTTVANSKIGLLYLSDYYYAYNGGGTTDCYNNSCTNWINGTTGTGAKWTMTRYGESNSKYHAWRINSTGKVVYNDITFENAVFPVFYLKPNVYITNPEATGSSTDPFILAY